MNTGADALGRPSVDRSWALVRRALPAVLFLEIPAVVVGTVIFFSLRSGMADFRVFRQAGRDVLDGRSPYPDLHAAAIAVGQVFVYPPVTAFAMAPFSLLPFTAAAALYALLVVAAVLLTLWVLGVRDQRCYAFAFLPGSVLSVVGSGALSAFLALGLALAWRFRDRLSVTVPVVALAIVAKLLLWPLLVWLLATRRWAAASGAALAGAVLTASTWAAIGFDGLSAFPRLLSRIARLEQTDGYSLVALGHASGLGIAGARAAAALIGVALLVATVLVARRPLGDQRSFIIAIAASLALSPVVWLHYFVLLLVPLALARPRFTPLWLLPMAFWLCPIHSGGELWRVLVGVGVAALALGLSVRQRPTVDSVEPATAWS
jgi:alpha-1,2-mannosyltransferase